MPRASSRSSSSASRELVVRLADELDRLRVAGRRAASRTAAGSATAPRAAAGRRRGGCAPGAGARRRPPRRCARARRAAARAPRRWPAPGRRARRSRRAAARRRLERAVLDGRDDARRPTRAGKRDRRADGRAEAEAAHELGRRAASCRRSSRRARRGRCRGSARRRSGRRARARVPDRHVPDAARAPRADRRSPSRRTRSAPCSRCGQPSRWPTSSVTSANTRSWSASLATVGGHAAQRGLLLGEHPQRLLVALALGDVAQVAGEHRRAGDASGRVMAISTGNSLPSARIAGSSTGWPTIVECAGGDVALDARAGAPRAGPAG